MTTFRVEKRIKHRTGCYEVVVTAVTVFNVRTWKTIVEREYSIHVWQIGEKLFAWRVATSYQHNGQTLQSTLLSGDNGGNGELYRGFARTWKEATKSFRLLAVK